MPEGHQPVRHRLVLTEALDREVCRMRHLPLPPIRPHAAPPVSEKGVPPPALPWCRPIARKLPNGGTWFVANRLVGKHATGPGVTTLSFRKVVKQQPCRGSNFGVFSLRREANEDLAEGLHATAASSAIPFVMSSFATFAGTFLTTRTSCLPSGVRFG